MNNMRNFYLLQFLNFLNFYNNQALYRFSSTDCGSEKASEFGELIEDMRKTIDVSERRTVRPQRTKIFFHFFGDEMG